MKRKRLARAIGLGLMICLLTTGCASRTAVGPAATDPAAESAAETSNDAAKAADTAAEATGTAAEITGAPNATENAADAAAGGQTTVTVDGVIQQGLPEEGASGGGARVYIWLGGDLMASFPFEEAHTIVIRQADGSENTVRMTGSAVYMEDATCQNHDCVQMGEVTMENIEMRVMGGFIVCLPQRVTVEVAMGN